MDRFSDWVERYRHAWLTNDPADIAGLFTDGALYYTEPFADPLKGVDAIVEDWIQRKDEPDTTEWSYEVLSTDGDLGFVQGLAVYSSEPPRTYSNLWVIRMEGNRCSEFTEWWMKHKP